MKLSKDVEQRIKIALKHNEEAHCILEDILQNNENTNEEEQKDKKVKLTIKVQNPYDGIEIDEKDFEQIRKDLEEIINDFTRE